MLSRKIYFPIVVVISLIAICLPYWGQASGATTWSVGFGGFDMGHDNHPVLPANHRDGNFFVHDRNFHFKGDGFQKHSWQSWLNQAPAQRGGPSIGWEISEDLSFKLSIDRDQVGIFQIYAYSIKDKLISIPFQFDSGSIFVDFPGFPVQPPAIDPNSVPIKPGWHLIQLTFTHQHESKQGGLNKGLRPQVDYVSTEPFKFSLEITPKEISLNMKVGDAPITSDIKISEPYGLKIDWEGGSSDPGFQFQQRVV